MRIEIGSLESLQTQRTLKFTVPCAKFDREAFALWHQDRIHAYYNECPHIGIALDWDDNDFWHEPTSQLHCKNHGALFNAHDGHCTNGPCVDTRLKPIHVVIENETLFAVVEDQ